jgi:hypothetical protein
MSGLPFKSETHAGSDVLDSGGKAPRIFAMFMPNPTIRCLAWSFNDDVNEVIENDDAEHRSRSYGATSTINVLAVTAVALGCMWFQVSAITTSLRNIWPIRPVKMKSTRRNKDFAVLSECSGPSGLPVKTTIIH